MIDIRSVALSKGVTTRGLGRTTLQHITHLCGHDSRDDDALRNDKTSLEYMHRDGEAPLFCYLAMKDKPDLMTRLTASASEPNSA